MKENIEHPGIIKSIQNQRLIVEIQPQAACGSCHSRSMCGLAESAGKFVEITISGKDANYSPGQSITVILQKSLGYKALFLGYLLPFLLLLVTLVTGVTISSNESLSAILSLIVVGVYYTTLYFYRNKVRESFHFAVKK